MGSVAALVLLGAIGSEDAGSRPVVVPPASTSSAAAARPDDHRDQTSELDLRLREPRITAAQRQVGMALELTLGATVLPGIGSFVVEDPLEGSLFLVSGLGFRALTVAGLVGAFTDQPGADAMIVSGLVGTGVVLLGSLINIATHGRHDKGPAWAR
jgi:hypothetical protein